MSDKKETIPSLDEMTMRDLAAFFAMQGFCANPEFAESSFEVLARYARKQADAMLKELDK